jgi:hypothetical protein
MRCRAWRLGWAGLLLAVVVGCNKTADHSPAGGASPEEAQVREKYKDLQAALKAQDADKLWDLLSKKSQAEAEQSAKDVRAAYEQAGPEEKARQEKSLGLGGAELGKLAGPGFLKTKRFVRKYDEVPESPAERVTVERDNATVYFTEPDGDKEKIIFVREDGQWKAWLKMPRPR